MSTKRNKIEFGDFQTPLPLALGVLEAVGDINGYDVIIEPTCGYGTFLQACLELGVGLEKLEGWEINPAYVKVANNIICNNKIDIVVKEQDFFKVDWRSLEKELSGKSVLYLGNPPWVTNTVLSAMLSENLPEKCNFKGYSGLEAMTGKSNFDISEWIIIQLLNIISNTDSSVAFLIKTSVARSLFLHIAENNLLVSDIAIKKIDAGKHFGVNVDACLFFAKGSRASVEYNCKVYTDLNSIYHSSVMGYCNGKLVSDYGKYKKLERFDGKCQFVWRSGIKHDACKVMEFEFVDGVLCNGYSEKADIPDDFLFPMYKCSQIAKKEISDPKKYMLVTQRKIGDNTDIVKCGSPETWKYLIKYSEILNKRKSSIYRAAPRFAIFGVGEYSFMPWKIVVSGLYKTVVFNKIGTYDGKPIVVDDTSYMLGFDTEEQADLVLYILNSEICREFISSIIFTDSKRPVTVSLLNRIDIKKIAIELGVGNEFDSLFSLQQEFSFIE